MTFNLTPMRLRALRMIQQRPGMVAAELSDLTEKQLGGLQWSQARTRWGAGYAKPLVDNGLVKLEWYDAARNAVHYGGGKLKLTAKGQEVARTGHMIGG